MSGGGKVFEEAEWRLLDMGGMLGARMMDVRWIAKPTKTSPCLVEDGWTKQYRRNFVVSCQQPATPDFASMATDRKASLMSGKDWYTFCQ